MPIGERVRLHVFKPGEIGGVVTKNRLVRSATYEGLASEDGVVTDRLVELYKALAEGGVGLIITGYAYVQPSGKDAPYMTGIDRDDLIPGLRRIAEAVHEHGDGCKAAVQLAHCGRQSFCLEETLAPSAVLEPVTNKMPREMTVEGIEETEEAFAEAARRAREAGFDAVELHAAHGYLLSEFLSPYTNRRTDDYGGNTKQRVKIVREIFDKTLEKVGKDFPISIKMNVDDFLQGGMSLEESKKIAQMLSRMGFAAIETSGGMWETRKRSRHLTTCRTDIRSRDAEAYFLPYVREIKKIVDKPLILVGGIRSLDVAEEILSKGDADFVAMSRPLIREPNLPNKWLKGIRGLTAQCISCNACFGSLNEGGVRCVQKERSERESGS